MVERASRLVDRFATPRAQMTSVKDGAAEDAERLVEIRAVVMDEAPVRVLARQETLELL
jgi:hypothetical protein